MIDCRILSIQDHGCTFFKFSFINFLNSADRAFFAAEGRNRETVVLLLPSSSVLTGLLTH